MKRLVFLAFVILVSSWSARAQFSRIYSSDNGLPSNQVNCIFQDKRGYIWFATQDGLSRFDGMEFESIRTEGVISFFEDSSGLYWVGTARGLFTKESGKKELVPFELEEFDPDAAAIYISDITEVTGPDRRKEILICTSAKSLYVIDEDSHQQNTIKQEEISKKLASSYINKLYVDSNNLLWIGSEMGGLTVIDYNTLHLDNVCRWSPDLEAEASSIVVAAFAEDPQTGVMYLGTQRHGILVYEDGIIRRSKGKSSPQLNVTSLLYNDIFPDGSNRSFIIGTESTGFKFYDIATETARDGVIPNVLHPTDTWKIHCLMKDNQGNMWAGAYLTGVLVSPKSMFGFEYNTFSNRGIIGENTACITAIYEHPAADCLWVGSDGGGLFKVKDKLPEVNYNERNTGLPINSVMAITMDKREKLWIGTYQDGLFTYSRNGGWKPFAEKDKLLSSRIKALAYDAETDRLYVGTAGGGLAIVDAASGAVLKVIREAMNQWVSALHIDHSGIVWVGTYNGPMLYDPKTETLTAYRLGTAVKDLRIYAVSEGGDGTIWFGTGNGLVGINRITGDVQVLTEEDGLCSNSIKTIQCSNGSVWVSTGNGLFRYYTATRSIDNFYAEDGLQGNEFHTGASFKDDEGRLYFGGGNGVTSFIPHLVDRDWHEVPPLHLYDLTVMGEKQDRPVRNGDRINLPNSSKMFTIAFAALEYTNPGKMRYSYILDGFERTWHHADVNSRVATYTNVPHGNYTLLVRNYFDGKESDYHETSLDIHIQAPPYLRWWAFVIYGLLLIAFGVIGYRIIQDKKERYQEEEMSRIKEARLGMFTNFTHEIRTPLNLVMSPLKKLRENESDPRQKDTYNLMYRNCLRINRIVNQLLDIRKIDDGQMKLHFVETDIIYFIKDIMQSFSNLAADSNIAYELSSEHETENLWIDQGNFDKIIFNILSNAFKHTKENGNVRVFVSGPVDGKVDISIYNSGSSIDEKYLDKVFERFFQVDPTDATKGSGVGLNLAKMLVDLHHGSITAENKDNGVVFTVTMPVGCVHLSKEELSITDHHKDLYTRTFTTDDVAKAPLADPALLHKTKTKKTIVVAEDDTETLEFMKTELGKDYNVVTCENGAEAWPEITRLLPDAVITDLIMPVMDGYELCSKIRHNPSTNHIPVIFLTSQKDEETEKMCTDVGGDRFYAKPVAIDILESGMAQAIASRNMLRGKYGKEDSNDYEKVSMPTDRNKLYSQVINYIKEHIDDPDLSVETISEEMGMSRVHLNRKLKEAGAASPIALIKSIRLKQAAYLLVHNKVNVSEVAFKVGFTTHSYFTRAFRDYFGMTPKEFVTKYQNDKENPELSRLLE